MRHGPPPGRAARPHLHGPHARGLEFLVELFPGFTEQVVQARAWTGDSLGGVRWQLSGQPLRRSKSACRRSSSVDHRPSAAEQPLLADSCQVGDGVEGVLAWWSAEPWWWVEFGNTAGHVDSPAGMVEELVVATAQGDAVSDAGRAIIGPMDNVMNFAPAGWYRTPGKGASAVADNDCSADRGGYGIAGPPDIQGLTAGTQHHRNNPRITRDAASDVGVDRTTQPQ